MNGSVLFRFQNYGSHRNQWVTEFNLYGRNSDTDEWTLLTNVTGLTYSTAGQKRRIYFPNNTPYNQFKFENFGTGDSSSCTWRVQSLDLCTSLLYFVASSDWDSIPLNVQSLIFDSNSFPDMIDVDLSNFTSLQSLQFREGSFASASSLTIIGYHIFLYSFIGLTQLNTILFHNHSFPITHSIILQDLSVHSIQVGEDCFNGIGSFEGRRLDSTSIAKLTLKNNGMLQEMKIPAGSFTQIKNIEMSNLQNLKMIEIEGEKGEKGAPFQSTSSFVTNGTPNLEVMKLGNKVCQSGSVFSIDSKMIKEVEIGKKCFQGTDKESQYGAKAQQFVMIDQPKLISTKIDKSSFVYFDTYNLMNNPKQMIANVAYSKSGNSSVSVDDLPSFSGVKEIVMKNLTSLEETVFGKGSFPNVTVINLSELPVVKNITLEEGSFGKTEELILVSE